MALQPWLTVPASALFTVLAFAACGATGEVGDGPSGGELCVPLTGKACAVTDQACTLRPRNPDFLYEAVCSDIGAFQLDEVCTPHLDASDCAAGLACVPLGTDDPEPRCATICTDDSGCAAGEECFVPGVAVAANATAVGTCRATCIVGSTACAGAETCLPRLLLKSLTGATEEVGSCNPKGRGTGATGSACSTLDDCIDGDGCLGITQLTCHPLCSALATCAAGTACVADSTSPDAAGPWYGICASTCATDADCTAPATCQTLAGAPAPSGANASVCIH